MAPYLPYGMSCSFSLSAMVASECPRWMAREAGRLRALPAGEDRARRIASAASWQAFAARGSTVVARGREKIVRRVGSYGLRQHLAREGRRVFLPCGDRTTSAERHTASLPNPPWMGDGGAQTDFWDRPRGAGIQPVQGRFFPSPRPAQIPLRRLSWWRGGRAALAGGPRRGPVGRLRRASGGFTETVCNRRMGSCVLGNRKVGACRDRRDN